MSVDLEEIKKLIELCRKKGVSEIETSGLRIKLTPSNPVQRRARKRPEELKVEDVLSDEDILFWSAGEVN